MTQNGDNSGPFSGPGGSSDQRLFLRVRPVCLKILALSRPGSHTSPELPKHLAELRLHLVQATGAASLPSPLSGCAITPDPNVAPIGSSVLHYIFFPISQIFQASPKGPADLPDRTKEEAFACLSLLVGQWWRQWLAIGGSKGVDSGRNQEENGQMWRQLLILGAVALTGPPATGPSTPAQGPQKEAPPTKPNSPETTLEILRLLHTLLAPRNVTASAAQNTTHLPKSEEWEWDGESELPSLEDADEIKGPREPPEMASQSNKASSTQMVYPNTPHLKLAESPSFKSPLLHALTAALDLAVGATPDSSTLELRSTAIEVVRVIITVWIPATTPIVKRGEKLAPIMPGVVSKVIRLLTSTSLSSDTKRGSPKSLPGTLVARALMLLKELIVPVLSNDNTASLRAQAEKDLQTSTKDDSKSLEEVMNAAQMQSETQQADEVRDSPVNDKLAASLPSGPARTLNVTVQNLRLAFSTLDGRNRTPDPIVGQKAAPIFSEDDDSIATHSHPLAQQALVELSGSLLVDCRLALLWYESHNSNSQLDRDNVSQLTSLLLQWLLDLSSSSGLSHATYHLARNHLQRVFHTEGAAGSAAYSERVSQELLKCIQELPSALLSQRGARVAQLSDRIRSVLSIATIPSEAKQGKSGNVPLLNAIGAFLQSRTELERWASRLVQSLQLSVNSTALADDRPHSSSFDAPALPLLNISEDEAKAVAAMLMEWGKVCAMLVMIQAQGVAGYGREGSVKSKAKSRQSDKASATDLITFFLDYSRRNRVLFSSLNKYSEPALTALSTSSSALFVAREMMKGLVTVAQDSKLSLMAGRVGKKSRKQIHAFANAVIEDVIECWQEESRALTDVGRSRDIHEDVNDTHRDLLKLEAKGSSEVAEQMKGLPALASQEETVPRPSNFGPALNLSFVSVATMSTSDRAGPSSKGLSRQSQRALVLKHIELQRSVQVELLALSALLLGPSYQPHLLPTLYPMISALTHPSQSISRASGRSLETIAFAAGYTDLLSCVRENIDYILGEASWRLVAGLGKELEAMTIRRQQEQKALEQRKAPAVEPKAGEKELSSWVVGSASDELQPLLSARTPPLVLTEVMRLLGPSSLHLIEDSIDEVLDALDRFHGYDDICDALLGVLDRLLEVMRSETAESSSSSIETAAGPPVRNRSEKANVGISASGTGVGLDDLVNWLNKRKKGQHLNPPLDVPSAFDAVESEVPSGDGKGEVSPHSPPTSSSRSQKLLVAILSKSLPFLSHSSPIIRTRVLRLLGAGTQLLAPVSPVSTGGEESQRKWIRREDELLPLINRAWPLVVARLGWDLTRPLPSTKGRLGGGRQSMTERETFVHLEALNLLDILAIHVPEFIGDRITKEAWPRIRLLLQMEGEEGHEGFGSGGGNGEHRVGPKTTRFIRPDESNLSAASAAAQQTGMVSLSASSGSTVALDPSTPLYKILLRTFSCFSALMESQGPRFPDETLWEVMTIPLYCASLDARQHADLRTAAIRLGRASRGCDGAGTVWAVMRCLLDGRGEEATRWMLLRTGIQSLDVRLAAVEMLR